MDTTKSDQTLIELIKVIKKEVIERKWAEKKASDALDYAESIIDSVPSPIIVIDNDYKIISVNISFFQLFNIPIEESVGKKFFEISNNIFNIDALKQMLFSNEKEIEEFELCHDFHIIGKKHFQIRCVNLQYNIKHLNFKLIIINDITHLKNTMNDLQTKHLLLNEIHHRTKNNLLMIEGLLKLQLNEYLEPNIKQFLIDNIARVAAIVNVHMMLGESDDFENIFFNKFILKLIDNIKTLYPKRVSFNIDSVDFRMTFDQSIYLGIVINEIISNSFKHAFNTNQTSEPTINIVLDRIENSNRLVCLISDNGNNENLKLDIENSLGVKIIQEIVESNLNGKWSVRFDKGLIHQIEFEVKNEIIKNV